MTEKIRMVDVIVSEIFPLRPSCEKPLASDGDRKTLRKEAGAMIRYLDRAVGKRPASVRFALLAGHERLICYFCGDLVSHWQFVSNVDKYWPEEWDNKALGELGFDVEPQLVEKQEEHLTQTAVAVSGSSVSKAIARLEARGKQLLGAKNLLEEKEPMTREQVFEEIQKMVDGETNGQ